MRRIIEDKVGKEEWDEWKKIKGILREKLLKVRINIIGDEKGNNRFGIYKGYNYRNWKIRMVRLR